MLCLHYHQQQATAAAQRPCNSVLALPRSCCRLQPRYGHAQARISTTVVAAARRGGGAGGSGGSRPPRRNNRDEGAPDSSGSPLARTITKLITSSKSIIELSDVFNQWSSSFNFINTAAAITKAAKLPDNRSGMVTQLLDRLAALWEEQLPAGDVQGMANVLWACGKLRYASTSLWSSTVDAFMQRHKGQAVPQNYSNLLYALASIALSNKGAVRGLMRQEVAEVFEQLTGEVYVMAAAPATIVSFQDISNILWAHAKLGIQPPAADLCGLLKAAVRPKLLDPAPAISLEFAQQCAEQLLQGSALQRVSAWNNQDVGNTMIACGRLGLRDEQLFQSFAAAAPSWLPKANTAEVNQVALACGQLGFRDTQLLAGLVRRAQQLCKPSKQGKLLLSARDQVTLPASVAWAVAVLDVPELVGSVEQLVGASGIKQLDNISVHVSNPARLWFVHTWLTDHHPELLCGWGLAGLLTEQQLQQCKQAAAEEDE